MSGKQKSKESKRPHWEQETSDHSTTSDGMPLYSNIDETENRTGGSNCAIHLDSDLREANPSIVSKVIIGLSNVLYT